MHNVLEIIKHITASKFRFHCMPAHALRMEILNCFDGTIEEMDSQLTELLKAYTIVDHRTINDTSYELTEL